MSELALSGESDFEIKVVLRINFSTQVPLPRSLARFAFSFPHTLSFGRRSPSIPPALEAARLERAWTLPASRKTSPHSFLTWSWSSRSESFLSSLVNLLIYPSPRIAHPPFSPSPTFLPDISASAKRKLTLLAPVSSQPGSSPLWHCRNLARRWQETSKRSIGGVGKEDSSAGSRVSRRVNDGESRSSMSMRCAGESNKALKVESKHRNEETKAERGAFAVGEGRAPPQLGDKFWPPSSSSSGGPSPAMKQRCIRTAPQEALS